MAIAGRVAIMPKGDWNAATAYKRLDAVTYNNTLYFAKKDVPAGTATNNTEYWSKSLTGNWCSVATAEDPGIVKPDGRTITLDSDGTIHGVEQYKLPTASHSTLGGIKPDGTTIKVDANGTAKTQVLESQITDALGYTPADKKVVDTKADASTLDAKANKTDLTTPFNFKGSCLSSALPSSAEQNDTWYCTDLQYRKTWNGSGWYQSSIEEAQYVDELSSLKEDMNCLNDNVSFVHNALYTLESGSVSFAQGDISAEDKYRSNKIWLPKGSAVFILPYAGFKMAVLYKSEDDTIPYKIAELGTYSNIIKEEGWYRFIFDKNLMNADADLEDVKKGIGFRIGKNNNFKNDVIRKATSKDFVFETYEVKNGNFIYKNVHNRARVCLKFQLVDYPFSMTCDDGYNFLVTNAFDILTADFWNKSIKSTTIFPSNSIVILRREDDGMIEDLEEFMTHFKFDIMIDTNKRLLPNDGVIHFSVPVNKNMSLLNTDKLKGDTESIVYDNGILVLPKNYSENGKPLRLVIVCHGAGATPYELREIDSTGKILGDPQRVLTKLGYAVMDTYAMPYEYSGSTTELHYGNELVLQCYIKAYQYVIENYNVKTDGVLLSGSSMGGLSMFQIIQNSKIPVLGAVGYCPCVDLFKQAYCNPWGTNQRQNIAKYYGFTGESPVFTEKCPPNTDEIEYFRNNADKVIGFYPLLFNETNGSINELLDANNLPLHYTYSTAETDEDVAERKYYEKLRSSIKVPLLIIHNEDDSTMAYKYTRYFIDMLKRNGQMVKLKTYKTGGHSAWANGEDTEMKDLFGNTFVCKESQKIGVEWLEMLDY